MRIHFLNRSKIDDIRWNSLASSQPDVPVYFNTWYLDAVTDSNWNALIMGDYDYAMPLPARRKFFLPYIFQPFITQQLGIIGKKPCSEEIVNAFFSSIPKKYLIVQLSVFNSISKLSGFSITRRQNHTINLRKGYESIAKDYNRNTNRNIRTAKEHNFELRYDIGLLDFLNFQSRWEPGNFTLPNQEFVKQLTLNAQNKAEVTIAGVYSNKELIATGLFIANHQRVYFLLCSSSQAGKEKRAMFYLIDQIIQNYAGQPKIFDFTGSSIKSIEQRNLGFGAEVEYFSFVSRDTFLIKLRERV